MTSTAIPSPKGETLKPCPFGCAASPYPSDRIGNQRPRVHCPTCFAQGPSEGTVALAIAAWNRRSTSSSEDVRREAEEMFLAPSGEGKYAADWADKPHRVLYDAVKLIRALSQKE